MTAQLIDGNALAKKIRAEVAERAAALTAKAATTGPGRDPGRRRPGQPGLREAQGQGLRKPSRRALGAREATTPTLSEAELLARIDALNADPAIHGILVQMPLPKHIDPHKVIERISPAKDVDGFSCSAPAS
jgi:methylenetetrahydrofolate dehydrogenase (NADP+)/methenyltetrahydrofolate cyclohydrolase